MSYEELLDIFWQSHNPTRQPWSRQYYSIIFYHNEEQRQLAEASKTREEERLGQKIVTEIVPYTGFTLAEDHHQKYRLQNSALGEEYRRIYPELEAFVNSTAAARVNGYLAGYGTLAQLEAEMESLGLSQRRIDELRRIVEQFKR